MTRNQSIAWAAGFFEGEGCISRNRDGGASLQLVLVNTDLERLRLFADVVGAGAIRERTHVAREGLRAQYQWQVYGANAVAVFEMLQPWLGPRRCSRFAEIIAAREAHIADATRERHCAWCETPFRPAWGPQSRRKRYCSSLCISRAQQARRSTRVAA